MKETKKIGRHKYNHLKSLEILTEEEKRQVQEFEKRRGIGVIYKTKKEKTKRPAIEGPQFTLKTIYPAFLASFELNEGKPFETKNKDALTNLEPVIKYFARIEDFHKSPRVIKQFMGTDLKPSLDKGLMIIGHPGNGKTATMNAHHKLFNEAYTRARKENWDNAAEWMSQRFSKTTSIKVSNEYESLASDEKEEFWKKYSGHRYFFDDVGREHIANNYGKKDVFQDILFSRHEKKRKTYITMNYKEGSNDIEETMIHIGKRYGSHIFDRLFEMFNIIEYKGKSFRK